MASLTLLFLALCLATTRMASSASIQAECEALLKLKSAITTDRSGRLAQWGSSTSDCCQWIGVTCDPKTGHVISLNLSKSATQDTTVWGETSMMTGFLSPAVPLSLPLLRSLDLSSLLNLSGPLPPSLFASSHLQVLNLQENKFSGRIPPFLSIALQYLNLASNGFSGPIPPDLGRLRNLAFLDLSANPKLKGPFPSSIISLSKLETLHIIGLDLLSGTLPPDLSNMVSLTTLKILSLPKLTGQLPLRFPKSLKTLSIVFTKISGSIPSSFGLTLRSLEELDLSYNQLQGSIPPSLGLLSNLKKLVISGNLGLTGPIPESVGDLSHLQYMTITGCGIIGPLPQSIGKLSTLIDLDLRSNRINGTIPASFGQLSALTRLGLEYNQLSGRIPDGFASNLLKLEGLFLYRNNIVGLPNDMSRMTSLSTLFLDDNKSLDLKAISGIATLPSLFFLSMRGCNLVGTIPSWFTTVRSPILENVDISNNALTGPIPSNITNLANLAQLNLAKNKLSGPIPTTLGDLKRLGALKLFKNKLSGSIPLELSKLDLFSFDVSYNRLTGEIPQVTPFTKFDDLSYVGNPGLCGPPLPPCK